MSYLNVPRLHFAGKFQADPSTVNNDPEHFNTNAFKSNYDISAMVQTMAGGTLPEQAHGVYMVVPLKSDL